MSNGGDKVGRQLSQVGFLCGQWAYLEFCLEITHWWLIGLFENPESGRVITGQLSLETIASQVRDLSHLKLDGKDQAIFKEAAFRIDAISDERNLAVHGRRRILPDETITSEVTRGKFKNAPQTISDIRLQSLNDEIGLILALIEPVLVRLKILGSMTEFSAQQQSLRQAIENR